MSYLITKYIQAKKFSKDLKTESNKWFNQNLLKPSPSFKRINVGSLKTGCFYFIKYDLQGLNKSTKIEKYSIAFIVDYKPKVDKTTFWAINFNFLPSEVRKNFFLKFLDEKYDNELSANESRLDWSAQNNLPVDYDSVLKEMIRFNIVYGTSIRPYRIDLINELYGISTNNITQLISLDVRPISGMDDAGIAKVLSGKLKNEGIHGLSKDLITVRSEYEEILKELHEKFSNLEKLLNK